MHDDTHDDARDLAPARDIDASWLDAAGALYLAGVRGTVPPRKGSHTRARPPREKQGRRVPLDRVVAAFLEERRGLGDAGRGFIVDVAQSMWRMRARIDAAASTLSFEATRGAMAALYLVGARGLDARSLPIDVRGAQQLVDAWSKTSALPLATRASMPAWLVDEIVKARPHDGEALCLAMTDAPRTTLRANRLLASRDDVITALAREGISAHEGSLCDDAVILDARANVFRTRAFHDGWFEMQDEGSQLVSLLCEARPGMVVVDGCAGAGGKTLHLAALMEGKGTIHAFDPAHHRLDDLKQRARRAGAHNIRVHDDLAERKRLKGAVDVVLVDAPCSGSGVLRRNPDTSWSLARADVDRMRAQQSEILDAYAPLVKPGGRLVYATCSLLDDENASVVDAFLARAPGFVRAQTLALDPLTHGTDGFAAAALVHSG